MKTPQLAQTTDATGSCTPATTVAGSLANYRRQCLVHPLRKSPPTSSINPTSACSSKQNSRQACGRCHQDTRLRLHPARVHLATTIVKSPLHHAAKICRLHRGRRNSVPPVDHSRHHVFQKRCPQGGETTPKVSSSSDPVAPDLGFPPEQPSGR